MDDDSVQDIKLVLKTVVVNAAELLGEVSVYHKPGDVIAELDKMKHALEVAIAIASQKAMPTPSLAWYNSTRHKYFWAQWRDVDGRFLCETPDRSIPLQEYSYDPEKAYKEPAPDDKAVNSDTARSLELPWPSAQLLEGNTWVRLRLVPAVETSQVDEKKDIVDVYMTDGTLADIRSRVRFYETGPTLPLATCLFPAETCPCESCRATRGAAGALR